MRHENYWGESFLDEVQIIDFSDQAALVNALTSGDIDVAIDLPYAQAGSIESNGDLVLLESAAGNWQTITMRVDMAPFDDVRVRQAMRLIVDRDEMVQRVLSGHGRVGNDMYGVLDGSYPKDFPQRTQDIEQAKALLKEAGQEGLTIELFAPDDTAGLPEYATAFAEQAKEAGINVTATVLDGGTYWGAEYTNRVFATSYWSTRPYLNQVAAGCAADGHLSRDPLAPRRVELRGAVQPGDRRDRSGEAIRHHRGDAEAGVRGGRQHHRLLPESHRRSCLVREGCGRPPEPAQLRSLRPRLEEHLARPVTLIRARRCPRRRRARLT